MARNLFLLCVVCAVLLVIPATVSAADVPSENLYYRPYSALFDPDKFWIMSSPVGQFNDNDRYDLGFENGTLWVKYWYASPQYNDPDWWFEVTLKELVEFWDDGNGQLDTADTVLSTVNLTGNFYSFTMYEDDPADFLTAVHSSNRVGLQFVLTERPREFDDVYALPLPSVGNVYTQMPTEVLVKASFFRSDYNITDTSLALVAQTRVVEGYTVLYQQHLAYTELNITDGTEGGYFSWSTTANDPDSVFTSATYDSVNLTIVYDSHDVMNHGFVIGVRSMAQLSGVYEPPEYLTPERAYGVGIFVSIGIIAVAIAVTIIWRRRALKKDEEVIER